MKLGFSSEIIMLIFILGLAFFTVIQPTFYPSYSTPPAGGPTSTPTPPTGGATPTPTPTGAGTNSAFFTITPSTSTIKKNETLTFILTLNTGDFEVDAIDLILKFDPVFLKAESITPKINSLQYTAQTIDNGTGSVIAKAAGKIQNGQVIGFRGTGEYIKIVFQALEITGSTPVSFDSNSIVTSAGVNRLDLNKCQPGNYQIIE